MDWLREPEAERDRKVGAVLALFHKEMLEASHQATGELLEDWNRTVEKFNFDVTKIGVADVQSLDLKPGDSHESFSGRFTGAVVPLSRIFAPLENHTMSGGLEKSSKFRTYSEASAW